MSAPSLDQPAHTQAGAPPLPVTLRAIATWLESHPEIEAYSIHLADHDYGTGPVRVNVYGVGSPERMAAIATSVGGRWEKRFTDSQFHLRQQIAPDAVVELTAMRSDVCQRVVTGTTTIEEPDPDALAAVPKVTREVETYEWRCEPILAAATGETA